MTKILQVIPGIENSMDDILIHVPDINTLPFRTRIVFEALKEAETKLNLDKCEFEVQFLGHVLTPKGIS